MTDLDIWRAAAILVELTALMMRRWLRRNMVTSFAPRVTKKVTQSGKRSLMPFWNCGEVSRGKTSG